MQYAKLVSCLFPKKLHAVQKNFTPIYVELSIGRYAGISEGRLQMIEWDGSSKLEDGFSFDHCLDWVRTMVHDDDSI